MKTELVDINETRKNLRIEIPPDVVDAEIERIARGYSRTARVPGFRPGKVPARVIRQRYKDQILHDVANDLIPRAVDDALRERGVAAVDTPDIRDVTVEEGQPLTFTASFDTVPPFEPGEYGTLTLRRKAVHIEEQAVEQALQRLRDRAARFEPVEGRGVGEGDSVTVDLERRRLPAAVEQTASSGARRPAERTLPAPELRQNVNVEIGAAANPPGFDEQLMGLETDAVKSFAVHYPADHPIGELANADVSYKVTVKAIKRRVLPDLDDEFAKDLGEFDTLAALRARIREDLEHEARHGVERELRADLMKQLASRVPYQVPASLVERELDRRTEDFAQRLMDQGIDPRETGIEWDQLREAQRAGATEAVGGAIALDQIARRERIDVTSEEIDREITRYAERTGRAPAAVRARLEKEGGLSRIQAGLRREKSIDFLMAHATILGEV